MSCADVALFVATSALVRYSLTVPGFRYAFSVFRARPLHFRARPLFRTEVASLVSAAVWCDFRPVRYAFSVFRDRSNTTRRLIPTKQPPS